MVIRAKQGMSTIDLLVVVILFVITGLGLVWGISKVGMGNAFLVLGGMFVLSWIILLPVWINNDRKEKLHLKELFEKDMIEPEHYRNQVGEKFYRQHHGEEPGDNSH